MPWFGDMRERVRFDRRTKAADDGYGNVTYDWAPFYGPVAARIEPSPGSESVDAGHVMASQPATMTIRWSPAAARVQPQDRVVDVRSGRTWNIAGASNEDGRRQFVTIAASAGGADG